MAKRSTKKAEYQARADEAIRAQMSARKALVGAIGAAEEKFDQQQQIVAEAQKILHERATEVADAYAKAIAGGWTAAELKELGIIRPEGTGKQPKKSLSKTSSNKAGESSWTGPAADHAAKVLPGLNGQP